MIAGIRFRLKKCNLRRDCPDSSDESEVECPDIECDATQFRCGYRDCIDLANFCGAFFAFSLHSKPKSFICSLYIPDGIVNCMDEVDELNCNQTNTNK